MSKINTEELKNINNLVESANYELYIKLCKYVSMIEHGFSTYIFYYVEELNTHIKDLKNKELLELIEKLNMAIKMLNGEDKLCNIIS